MLQIKLDINDKIFLKDPASTELGQKILKNGILLLDELGLEDFNFRKLAQQIGSTESSLYRYFENKHYYFIYILNWYWEWLSTRIDLRLRNVRSPQKKINIIIKILIQATSKDADAPFIDEDILHRIVVREGAKAYHSKCVDEDNKYGFFLAYKHLTKKIANVILELDEDYDYPKTLAATMIETVNNNIYFAKHLPRLTDITYDGNDERFENSLYKLIKHLVYSSVNSKVKTMA